MADGDGFDDFYRAAFGRLVGQLFLVTGDLHEAEDVVQEAFARASARWSRLQAYAVPEMWVRRVAMNLALDGLRRTRRQLAVLVRLAPEPVVPPVSVESLAMAEALAALPRPHRQVIVLHYLVGLPVSEVARQVGVPVGTIKTRLARGRRGLAARLAVPAEEVGGEHG